MKYLRDPETRKVLAEAKQRREEKRRQETYHNISFKNYFKPYFASQIFWSSQVDKGSAETGVKGFAGWPLRPRLPHLQAARRSHGGRGGDHLAEVAGRELADLPWSVETSGIGKKDFILERKTIA